MRDSDVSWGSVCCDQSGGGKVSDEEKSERIGGLGLGKRIDMLRGGNEWVVCRVWEVGRLGQ